MQVAVCIVRVGLDSRRRLAASRQVQVEKHAVLQGVAHAEDVRVDTGTERQFVQGMQHTVHKTGSLCERCIVADIAVLHDVHVENAFGNWCHWRSSMQAAKIRSGKPLKASIV